MGRKLKSFVDVRDDDGAPFSFGPDDDVPAWASDRIRNVGAWAESGDDAADGDAETDDEKPKRGRPAKKTAPSSGQ